MRSSTGIVVGTLVVIGALLLLQGWLRPDPDRRALVFMPDMAQTPARRSLSMSAAFPGGLTQQPLQPGVVIRGSEPFPYGDGADEAARAGRELVNPFDATDAAALQRGAERFGIFCSHCHGNGEAPGPVVLRGMVPPPSLFGERARTIADGEIFHVITRGQGNMPAHGPQIPPEDRWKIILHVRALQRTGDQK